MKITREIKTAILVIASILLFIWGYSFLKGSNLLNSHKRLFVEFDNVEGLLSSASVTISGKVVGKVKSLNLTENGKILAELQINQDDFPISKTSVAQIYEPGFIGGKQIAIIPNFNDKNITVDGDRLKADVKLGLTDNLGKKLAPTQQKIESLVQDADQLMVNVNQILNDQAKNDLQQAIAQLSQTMAEFNKLGKGANQLLATNQKSLNHSLGNIEKITTDFSKVSTELEKAELGKTLKNLEGTLVNVNKLMADMQAGQGTLGKAMKDEAMYNNFTKAAKEIELLLQDLRLHPTRYVNVSLFGKKEKPYKGPELQTK
ncbi:MULTISPECIES: MlaD family protein [Flavobacterium]|uniref:MlaD family protein n=1 Tax=Flavobacterium TaxID=237 RepID=UPI000745B6E8|nr:MULTISPECIES: MlaD family protein [Flavobacterium]OXA75020.1 organic solvent ABC transporter substrate-binding protein [Flavobacterium columnare NBRC 100251 = ATCC 23463]AMA48569.1 organic solvent ABC transporter substrate-binding protein [Flavobacterium covae]AND65305.1 organic solvent ABC transporter substrate-binding protein [Flavobacterium covae]MCJ1807618.1 MlaD family protein [Flavobacterium covae]MCJ1807896.1 MlaD family protein [Flavobacterium covae]